MKCNGGINNEVVCPDIHQRHLPWNNNADPPERRLGKQYKKGGTITCGCKLSGVWGAGCGVLGVGVWGLGCWGEMPGTNVALRWRTHHWEALMSKWFINYCFIASTRVHAKHEPGDNSSATWEARAVVASDRCQGVNTGDLHDHCDSCSCLKSINGGEASRLNKSFRVKAGFWVDFSPPDDTVRHAACYPTPLLRDLPVTPGYVMNTGCEQRQTDISSHTHTHIHSYENLLKCVSTTHTHTTPHVTAR